MYKNSLSGGTARYVSICQLTKTFSQKIKPFIDSKKDAGCKYSPLTPAPAPGSIEISIGSILATSAWPSALFA